MLIFPILFVSKGAFFAYPYEYKLQKTVQDNYLFTTGGGRRDITPDDMTLPAVSRFAFERKYSLVPGVCVLLPCLKIMLWSCFLLLEIYLDPKDIIFVTKFW